MSLKLDYLAFISQIVSYSDSQRRYLASLNTASLCVQQLHLPYSTPKNRCGLMYVLSHFFIVIISLDAGVSVCFFFYLEPD